MTTTREAPAPGVIRSLIPARIDRLFYGYLLGAGVMILGGLVAAFIGVAAENKSLEDVATPFAARRARTGSTRAEGSAQPRYPT